MQHGDTFVNGSDVADSFMDGKPLQPLLMEFYMRCLRDDVASMGSTESRRSIFLTPTISVHFQANRTLVPSSLIILLFTMFYTLHFNQAILDWEATHRRDNTHIPFDDVALLRALECLLPSEEALLACNTVCRRITSFSTPPMIIYRHFEKFVRLTLNKCTQSRLSHLHTNMYLEQTVTLNLSPFTYYYIFISDSHAHCKLTYSYSLFQIFLPMFHKCHWSVYAINLALLRIDILDPNPYGPDLPHTVWQDFHKDTVQNDCGKYAFCKLAAIRLATAIQKLRPKALL